MKYIVNFALLKKKKEKREQYKKKKKKFTTFFTIIELANFYRFSYRFTINIILLLIIINVPHQQV